MARQTLDRCVKFKRLFRELGIPKPHARGHLETMWDVANECGNPIMGTPEDVEAAAEWEGEPMALFGALKDLSWIDEVEGQPGRWQIHHYWDHAPAAAANRAQREAAREERGREISEIRARAGRLGGLAKASKILAKSSNEPDHESNELGDVAKSLHSRHPTQDTQLGTSTSKGVSENQSELLLPTFALSAPDEGPKARARAGFDEFWKPYPNKKSKADAEKAWMQTYGKRPPLPELLAILERHKLTEQWQRDDGKGIPYGATWLRGIRWEDVLEVTGMPVVNGTNGHASGAIGKFGTTDSMRLAERGNLGRNPELDALILPPLERALAENRKRHEEQQRARAATAPGN